MGHSDQGLQLCYLPLLQMINFVYLEFSKYFSGTFEMLHGSLGSWFHLTSSLLGQLPQCIQRLGKIQGRALRVIGSWLLQCIHFWSKWLMEKEVKLMIFSAHFLAMVGESKCLEARKNIRQAFGGVSLRLFIFMNLWPVWEVVSDYHAIEGSSLCSGYGR